MYFARGLELYTPRRYFRGRCAVCWYSVSNLRTAVDSPAEAVWCLCSFVNVCNCVLEIVYACTNFIHYHDSSRSGGPKNWRESSACLDTHRHAEDNQKNACNYDFRHSTFGSCDYVFRDFLIILDPPLYVLYRLGHYDIKSLQAFLHCCNCFLELRSR